LTASPLENAAGRLRRWLATEAFPLWATAGFDRGQRRFQERLTLQGAPIADTPQRLIVQARQVYSYGLAHRRGWHAGAEALMRQGFASMVRDYYKPDGKPGWVFSVHSDGRVAEGRRDLYSHAFALMGIGSYVLATGDRAPLALADETLAYLDRELGAPNGGYFDSLPAIDDLRRQNPHMHLFEAMLTLWTASKERRFLERAAAKFELFAKHFFLPHAGVLCEYFDASLVSAAGTRGQIVEPGHHCEWIWLLRWFERETGKPVGRYVDALYDHAHRHGFDGAGLIVDELLIDGTHHLPSHRVWPVTEAIKANVAEAAQGRPGAADMVVTLVDQLFDRYFKGMPAGGWMDRLDAKGQPATDFMPASTLYHVACAIDEVVTYAKL